MHILSKIFKTWSPLLCSQFSAKSKRHNFVPRNICGCHLGTVFLKQANIFSFCNHFFSLFQNYSFKEGGFDSIDAVKQITPRIIYILPHLTVHLRARDICCLYEECSLEITQDVCLVRSMWSSRFCGLYWTGNFSVKQTIADGDSIENSGKCCIHINILCRKLPWQVCW